MKTIRRLIVSLDETWNNRDDSTNVLYSHSLAFECHEQECDDGKGGKIKVTQERYYQEGVGTGPLDRITGGGFGFGLDEHVREAYDWLVQNFEEGDGSVEHPPDEIYIFGFSRGAYTARSLVGFISTCGLLRRGAPLTVSQLWENSCILGLVREERRGGVMAKIFGEPVPKFRRITDLVWGPWSVRKSEVSPGKVPGQRKDVDLRPTEALLVRWSRRVKITYLGVYDTVGAMGWDALAIPGLRSKLAVQHNMRPTTIIQKCRHALAIDEHRSSFGHTPLVAYIGEKTSEGEMDRSDDPDPSGASSGKLKMGAEKWHRMEKMWNDKIEQRWFVGAHSNIGGGYPDNRLAQRPLEWILEGARHAGLICEKVQPGSQVTPSEMRPTDSFGQFAAPLWTMVFRAKRNYRIIDPKPELRANRDEAEQAGEVQAGFSLVNIHETVDESVLDYWKDAKAVPPNLIECAARQHDTLPTRKADLEALAKKSTESLWPGEGYWPQLALVLWATLSAAGITVTDRLFQAWPDSTPPLKLVYFLAGLFPLVDWLESYGNASVARKGATPFKRALLDSIYWTRALGVVLFVFGTIGALAHLWSAGWHAQDKWDLVRIWLPVALYAALGVLLGNVFNQTLSRSPKLKLAGIISGPVIVLISILAVTFVAQICGHVIKGALGGGQPVLATASAVKGSAESSTFSAGLLLLLQLGFVYYARAFAWVGEPMGKANLGSVTGLQKAFSATRVKACLDRWCKMLGDHHDERASECGMTTIVRQALWRDIIGFIPVYSLVLGFGFWFGAEQLQWDKWWSPLGYLWWVIPLVGAAADYVEDICHFRFLSLHEQGRKPAGVLPVFSFAMTAIKMVAVVIQSLVTMAAILCASGRIAFAPQNYGWRGLIGLSITTVTVLAIIGIGIWGLVYRLMSRSEKKTSQMAKG